MRACDQDAGWEVYQTATDTFMRRRRWYGWQTRPMTPEERGEYFKKLSLLSRHVEKNLLCVEDAGIQFDWTG